MLQLYCITMRHRCGFSHPTSRNRRIVCVSADMSPGVQSRVERSEARQNPVLLHSVASW
jgi:hypothetical protein